uniref:DNA mismatch repair protein PMS1 n=1 Tax=Talaromyces marneffei TaxID=37727 RepID=Q0MR13_TALMA|nr:PMS1-like protein [Talaromyces marneffei]
MGALLSIPMLVLPSAGTLLVAVQQHVRLCVAHVASFRAEHLTMDYMKIRCDGKACHGWVAVHRINFGLGLFHLLLSLLLLGVRSSKDGRAMLQNGFWGPKILVWIGFVVMSFFIPESFFFVYGHYIAFIAAMRFPPSRPYTIDSDSRLWRGLLIGSTMGMYLASFVMTILMYIFFAKSGCSMNQAAITINLLVFLIISVVSVQPAIQEHNPRAGLAQAAMVTVYCTYLTMSAVSMEPDDHQCNPLLRARGTRTASVVLGAIVTMATIAYTTTRAATQGIALGSNGGHSYSALSTEANEHGLVTQQPSTRREMRAEALRAAVESGSLPASALDESDDEDDEYDTKDDERGSTQYNYSLFHIIFFLATTWVATLLTQQLDPETEGNFASVGRTYWASWVKIISAWVHQIQSGQVIVDLCSVVKELVENSLDAGATSIEVRFKNDGLDSIEVQDNGSGIDPQNYESIALKHYTSKLASYDDLTSLTTFGFRGEALSSLCAVSNFHIITAQAHQAPKANKLEFEHSGKLKGSQIVAGQKGTTVSISNLFSRLPVRRKELEKNIKRELGKVINLLNEYACISTGVRFSVKNTDSKKRQLVLLTTKANASIRDNIANVYGAKTLLTLIPLELELEFEPSATGKRLNRDLNKIHVRGYVSRPVVGEGRGTRDRQMYYVNSRPCGIPQIAKAFNEVYKTYNISQAPFVLADFQMDTNAYDVNVSPDKRTILLHDSAALIESLKEALDQMFQDAEQTVPQSQFTINKQQTDIQQRLKPSPMRAPLDRSRTEQATPTEESQTDRSEPVQVTHQHAQEDKTAEVADNENITQETTDSQVTAISEDAAADESDHAEDADEAVKRIRARAAELSPQPGERRILTLQSQSPPKQNNVIQNAFDRMRPRRPPAEIATITIGDKVTTSIVGHGTLRKRDSFTAGNTEGKRQSKRRIYTPSKPNIFGQNLRSFIAPGIQTQAQEDEVEEDMDEDDGSNDEEMLEDTHSSVHSEESPDETEPVDEPVGETFNERAESLPLDDASTEPAKGVIDEQEKKAREDAKVQDLIRKAEEKGATHGENHIKRGKYIEKEQQTNKHSTAQIVGTLESSFAKIQAQMETLQRQLGSYKALDESKDDDELFVNQQKTGEERLSLTVSKDDFAKMRIVGQFNLGFILAIRSHGADEPTASAEDELFIIDQHASDEKYNFERLQAETVVQNQRLVHPKTLDLTAVEEEIIRENKLALEKNGFVIEVDDSGNEPIGRRCKLVSLPLSKEVVFDIRDLEELIVLLSEAPTSATRNATTSDTYIPRPSKVRKMFAMRACRSSIMIGKTLTVKQMEKAVRNMGTIDKPWNCPHGRPTMRHLMSLGSWDEYDEYNLSNERHIGEGDSRGPWQRYSDLQNQEEEEEEEESDEGEEGEE